MWKETNISNINLFYQIQLVITKHMACSNPLRYILPKQTDIFNVLYLIEIPFALLKKDFLMTQVTFQNNGEVSPSRLFRLP